PLPGKDPSADGTVVRKFDGRPPGTVVGVASERDVLVFDGDARLLPLLDEFHVAGKQLHVRNDRLTLVVSRENFHDEARVRDAIWKRLGDSARIDESLGAVSVVGAGINASFDNVRRGSDALTSAAMPPLAVATSSFRI